MYGLEKVFVFLEHNCAQGTHCFVDSENNGPWGRALIEELIPFIEKNYRVIPEADARLLTGQSSGAWAALWLQVGHPDFFGGAWPISPDPVDFRSFCGVDLYAKNANVFYEEEPDGSRRPRLSFTPATRSFPPGRISPTRRRSSGRAASWKRSRPSSARGGRTAVRLGCGIGGRGASTRPWSSTGNGTTCRGSFGRTGRASPLA